MSNKNIFGAPIRAPGRDPEGRPLSDYCLADNRAITCDAGEETMRPFVHHIASVFGFEEVEWACQSDIGFVVDGKHVRLDLVIVGEDGGILNVEAQSSPATSLIDRMTAYTAYLIGRQLAPGQGYESLRGVHVVFVCKGDPLKRGRSMENMEMAYAADGAPCGAKFRWTVLSFVHLKKPAGEAEWLLHDFFCKDVAEMHSPAMSNRLKYLRSEEGSAMMFETREEEVRRKAEEARLEGKAEGKAEGILEGKAEGILEGLERAALGMLRDGMPPEKVAAYTSLAIEAVRDIAAKNGIALP